MPSGRSGRRIISSVPPGRRRSRSRRCRRRCRTTVVRRRTWRRLLRRSGRGRRLLLVGACLRGFEEHFADVDADALQAVLGGPEGEHLALAAGQVQVAGGWVMRQISPSWRSLFSVSGLRMRWRDSAISWKRRDMRSVSRIISCRATGYPAGVRRSRVLWLARLVSPGHPTTGGLRRVRPSTGGDQPRRAAVQSKGPLSEPTKWT